MSALAKKELLLKVIISPELSISDAIPVLDKAGAGILLLCRKDRRLVGVVTDGDIRRAILKNIPFSEPCSKIANLNPVVANRKLTAAEALHQMDCSQKFAINHLPVVNKKGQVIELILRRDLISEEQLELSAVVMSGGFGTRLHPLTKRLPKPMLPLGDKPLLETIVKQLKESGIHYIKLATHYKAEIIADHFGDGKDFGVQIDYLNENTPLGTAGALGLMEKPGHTQLLMNGDILTEVNFRSMLAYHREHKAELTVAVKKYDIEVPYGVMELEQGNLRKILEKPVIEFFVNAGIYLLEPAVFNYIPEGRRFEITDLINTLIDEGRPVATFPIRESWLDIGSHHDLKKARRNFLENGRNKPDAKKTDPGR